MYHQFRLFRGIFFPSYISHQLRQAETLPGLWIRVCLLILSSCILHFTGAFYGLGNELFSNELIHLPSSDFESRKLLFILGETIWGLFFALFILFFSALFFWSVTDIAYQKLLSVQMYVLLVLLIEKGLYIILALSIGIDRFSSPFSFGVIIQYFTSNPLLIILFGSISIFHFWIIYLQYTYLNKLTERSPKFLLLIIVGLNAFLLIISTLLYYIRIEKLI